MLTVSLTLCVRTTTQGMKVVDQKRRFLNRMFFYIYSNSVCCKYDNASFCVCRSIPVSHIILSALRLASYNSIWCFVIPCKKREKRKTGARDCPTRIRARPRATTATSHDGRSRGRNHVSEHRVTALHEEPRGYSTLTIVYWNLNLVLATYFQWQ